MPSSRNDKEFLADMLAAAEEIREFTRGIDAEQFDNDLVRRRAVERSLEMLAEAQKNVSDEVKARHPEVPWRRLQDLGKFYIVTFREMQRALAIDEICDIGGSLRKSSGQSEKSNSSATNEGADRRSYRCTCGQP